MTNTVLLTLLIAGVFLVGSLATNEAFAAVDMFIKIKDIDGESKDDAHKDEIDVLSWSWGETRSSAHGAGGGAGKVSMQDLNFAMEFNKASPKLMEACANGKFIEEAILTVRKAGDNPVEYLKITLKDIIVSSYQTGGSAEDDIPVDNVSFNFNKIEFEYQEQKEDGSLGEITTGKASKRGRA